MRSEYETRIMELPEEDLAGYLQECVKSLGTEDLRGQSVDSRLTSIVGLCSIAGTIVFGTLLVKATMPPLGWWRWVMALGGLYLTAQLCAAILAAVRGLARREYLAIDPFPYPRGEAKTLHQRRRIGEYSEAILDHRIRNDEKVTQMAVAHRALMNFLVTLLLLACFGAYSVIKG
ncbi:MAG: hypothetical protein ABSH28_10400 [Acidobacteriota bacterium]